MINPVTHDQESVWMIVNQDGVGINVQVGSKVTLDQDSVWMIVNQDRVGINV
jgi:hypothetical protein